MRQRTLPELLATGSDDMRFEVKGNSFYNAIKFYNFRYRMFLIFEPKDDN